jgi:hypothetical protein
MATTTVSQSIGLKERDGAEGEVLTAPQRPQAEAHRGDLGQRVAGEGEEHEKNEQGEVRVGADRGNAGRERAGHEERDKEEEVVGDDGAETAEVAPDGAGKCRKDG